jgi:predicted transcriptional regulator
MRKAGTPKNSQLEHTIQEILKSKAQSKIYLFLLRKKTAKTEEIIRGTRLHPSTVRETLVKMHCKHLIIRKKYRNESIGKNPYQYSPLPPTKLIKKYVEDMEKRLNNLATLSQNQRKKSTIHSIKIKIIEQGEMQ